MVPSSSAVLEELAYLEFEAGNLTRAKDLYVELVQPGDYRPKYLINLGMIELLLGKHDQAATTFRQTVSLGWESPAAVLSLADAYRFTGNELADESYLRLLDLTEGSDDPLVIAYRARAMACLGRHADAVANIEHALSLLESADTFFAAAIVYRITGDHARSEHYQEKATTMGKGEVWFRLPWFDDGGNQ